LQFFCGGARAVGGADRAILRGSAITLDLADRPGWESDRQESAGDAIKEAVSNAIGL
jgi:hypothetical protein